MRIKKDFVLGEVFGRNVVMREGFGAIHRERRKGMVLALNGTATWLWQEAQAQGDFTVESLTARVCEEYDVTAEEARSYVTDFLGKLEKEGVIDKNNM